MTRSELSAMAMQAILSSEYVSDFIDEGRDGKSVDKYQAVAIEAVSYAKALVEELGED